MSGWQVGGDDAAERLMRQVQQYNSSGSTLSKEQVAAVLHGLSDHTALLQAVTWRADADGPAVSVGRWLHDLGDYMTRPDASAGPRP